MELLNTKEDCRFRDECYHALCHACNGSGYDYFDDQQCDMCKGGGDIQICPIPEQSLKGLRALKV